MTERRADDATRDVDAWLKCYFMRDKVGEVFTGKISAVTSFGVFVLLDDVHIEGLLHISELGKDYFHFDMQRQAIVGEKSGMTFKLGDALAVKVVRADLESAKIDFVLSAPAQGCRKTPPNRPRAKGAAARNPPRATTQPDGATARDEHGDLRAAVFLR